jgi:hypothetical protein
MEEFTVVGEISEVEPIARGMGVRDRARLNRIYGRGRWRKLKGHAAIRLRSGRVRKAELHWYEAHGIGRRELKRKRYLD